MKEIPTTAYNVYINEAFQCRVRGIKRVRNYLEKQSYMRVFGSGTYAKEVGGHSSYEWHDGGLHLNPASTLVMGWSL